MNTVRFAMFINYLTKLGMPEVSLCEMQAVHDQAANLTDLPAGKVSYNEVDALLMAMGVEGKKIEAIKAYRALTGADLRTSKDAVERYWKPVAMEPAQAARLGDILGNR